MTPSIHSREEKRKSRDTLYTDSSKTVVRVGAAVITDTTTYTYRLPSFSSIYSIKTELGKLLQDVKHIEIVWIPPHMGIRVMKGPIQKLDCREIQRVPYQYIYLQIKELICDRWRQRWQSLYDNKLRAINPNLVTQNYRALTRKQQVLLTRLRIGHKKFTHLHLLKHEEPRICDTCSVTMSVEHFISDCPDEERQFFGLPSDLTNALDVTNWPWNWPRW